MMNTIYSLASRYRKEAREGWQQLCILGIVVASIMINYIFPAVSDGICGCIILVAVLWAITLANRNS